MPKIAIVTDSNSGITQERAKELGITVMPMPFFVNGKLHYEDIDFSQEDFYRALTDNTVTVSTSQPSPGEVMALWEKLLKNYDEIVYIPMSSGLSASCGTAQSLAEEFGGKVQVVNNQRISVTQYQSVLDAMSLADAGYDAAGIRECTGTAEIWIPVYILWWIHLKYLKKGGRITPAVALIGNGFKSETGSADSGMKADSMQVRGLKSAKKVMLEAMHKDFDGRFSQFVADGDMALHIAYCYGQEETVSDWMNEVKASFPGMEVHGDLLSLSIVCHTGPGCLAIACGRKPRP